MRFVIITYPIKDEIKLQRPNSSWVKERVKINVNMAPVIIVSKEMKNESSPV